MKPLTRILLSTLLLAGLAGCGASLPERFYTLEARAVADPVAGKADYSVLVGPVSIPDLVDRPQMVLRVDTSRVTIAEQSRWAEPLKSSIGRAIAGNLGQLLKGARVASYPAGTGTTFDYHVIADVQTFDSAPGKGITLEMLWTVKASKGKAEKAGRSVISEAAGGKDPADLVAAHERALASASRDMATAIRELR